MKNKIDPELSAIIDEFLDLFDNDKQQNTYRTYRQAIKAFLDAGPNPELSREYYKQFLKITASNPATQLTYRSAVAGLYLYASAEHTHADISWLKETNKRFAKKRPERLPNFDREALDAVIAYCSSIRNDLQDLRDRAFVLTLADTGLRISEACGLKRGDLNWLEGQALVIGKRDTQALVRFSNRALAALKDYLAERAELDGATGKPLNSLPLFARHDKGAGKKIKPVGKAGMWYAVKQRAEEAGIDPTRLRVHDFRHYFITAVYLATRDLKRAQEFGRHKDIATTSRYAHLGADSSEIYDDIFNKRE